MKFAFSTVSCPKWDFETVAARAKEYGYHGVEVRGFLNESVLTASNPFLTDPAKMRRAFEGAGVEIACLSSSVAMGHDRKKNEAMAHDLRQYVDMARRIGCGLVKLFDTQLRPGQSWEQAAGALGRWVEPLADYAADQGVGLAVENALSFRRARELWMALEATCNPNVGAGWDLFNAAQVGERPSISVPVLNSRIVYAQVKDAKFGPLGAVYCKLGEGDAQVKNFMIRLMGIGYAGYVSVEWEKAWLPNIAEPEEILPDSIAKLKEWTKPFEPEKPAKPAAKVAPAKAAAAAVAK